MYDLIYSEMFCSFLKQSNKIKVLVYTVYYMAFYLLYSVLHCSGLQLTTAFVCVPHHQPPTLNTHQNKNGATLFQVFLFFPPKEKSLQWDNIVSGLRSRKQAKTSTRQKV